MTKILPHYYFLPPSQEHSYHLSHFQVFWLTHTPYSLDQHILHTLLPSHTACLLLTQLTKLLYLLAANHMLHILFFCPLKVAPIMYTQVSLRTHLLLRDHVTVGVCM